MSIWQFGYYAFNVFLAFWLAVGLYQLVRDFIWYMAAGNNRQEFKPSRKNIKTWVFWLGLLGTWIFLSRVGYGYLFGLLIMFAIILLIFVFIQLDSKGKIHLDDDSNDNDNDNIKRKFYDYS